MDFEPVKAPQVYKPRTFYSPQSLSGQLEKRMLDKGITEIGKPQPIHERRPCGMTMDPEKRAYRTLDVMKFSDESLRRIHAYEQAKMDRFLFLSEMVSISKQKVDGQGFLNAEILEQVVKYQNSKKPMLDREFLGLKIPPYFAYDLEFDGMTYQHAWDMSVKTGNFALPIFEDKKRSRHKI